MPIIGTSNLPVAPRGTPWDAARAKQRVFQACGDNVAGLSRAFLWRSDGDARTPQVYELGFADVIDGRLCIVPAGIAACAGVRGVGAVKLADEDMAQVQARITTVYGKVRKVYDDWPASPFTLTAALLADASGDAIEGIIAFEGVTTGDGRRIETGALTWGEGPWPIVFDLEEMDHSGVTVGCLNEITRKGKEIWGRGSLSDSEHEDVQGLVLRARELLAEGAVGVSVSLDDVDEVVTDAKGTEISRDDEWPEDVVFVTKSGRIRSVAIVDEAAFDQARVSLVASLRVVKREWFSNPAFGNGSQLPTQDGDDDRLVWQEPERAEEEGQFGCPLTVTEDGQIFGHAWLWGRCHVGYPGTCVRPPKEPAAYRGFLTGERIPGVPTGPLVMKTRHAPDHLSADAAGIHYDHTGYAVADITIGPDVYGGWVSGGVRVDASQAEIDILCASALSGDWRPIGGKHRLIGVLAVNGPGFRVSRALAASGALITVGPGCDLCDEQPSLEDRVDTLERLYAQSLVAGL